MDHDSTGIGLIVLKIFSCGQLEHIIGYNWHGDNLVSKQCTSLRKEQIFLGKIDPVDL